MNKTITLKNHGEGRYDDVSPFIIAEDLTIALNGLSATSGDYYAVLACNGKSAQKRIESNRITIEKSFLSIGALYMNVVYYLCGKKLGEWTVEPLCLQQATPTDFSASPTVAALEAETENLKKSIVETNGRIQALNGNFQALLKDMKKTFDSEIALLKNAMNLAEKNATAAIERATEKANAKAKSEKTALLKYIYRHYLNDLRDSEKDLSLSDFAIAIGLDISDLTEKEQEEITKFTTKEDVL